MPYRIAFAGLYFHIGCLLDAGDPRLQVTAIADRVYPTEHLFHNPAVNPEVLAAERGVPLYRDWREMLDREKPDILAVYAVDAQKAEIICEGLHRNMHVIADKPLCTTLEGLAKIDRALEQTVTGSLALLLPFPFYPIIRRLKEIIDSGVLGELLCVRSRRAYIQRVEGRPKWFYTKEYGGGLLCDIGTHDLDLVRFLTGKEVVEAVAFAGNGKIRQFPTAEDYAQAIFRMEDNLLYSLQLDRISPPNVAGDQSALEVYGTNGQVIIPQGYNTLAVTIAGRESPESVEEFPDGSYAELIQAYLDALDTRDYFGPFFAPRMLGSVEGILSAQRSADSSGEKVLRTSYWW